MKENETKRKVLTGREGVAWGTPQRACGPQRTRTPPGHAAGIG